MKPFNEIYAERFEDELYEVIDESVHKYASTSVSGGQTNRGYSAGVSSRTTYHSDQSIWLKNLRTGKEEKYEFTSFNVDARPGHILHCVFNKTSGRFERIANLNTDEMSSGNGAFALKEVNIGGIVVIGLLLTFLGGMLGQWAVLSTIMIIVAAYYARKLTKNLIGIPYGEEKSFKYGMYAIIGAGIFNAWHFYSTVTAYRVHWDEYRVISAITVISTLYVYLWLLNKQSKFRVDIGNKLTRHVRDFMANYKPEPKPEATEQKSA